MGYQVLENKGINAKVVEEHKDKLKNLRGQLYEHYDSSGKQWTEAYDFKGNAPESSLQLLLNPTLTDADWSLNPALSSEIFTTASVFDALNRPVTSTDPGGNIHEFSYDRGGALKAVELNSDAYVLDIQYDAKRQRLSIWYGNATKTKYEYDPLTFRLRRLLTTGNTGTIIYQDLHYWYDPAGNITEIQDDAQQTLYFNNSVVAPTQRFTYDALYRLIESKGRELIANATFGAEDNWNDNAWKTTQKGNGNDVQNYTQHYTYDAVGNILELQHIAGSGSYTRTYEIDTDSNRLLSTTVGANTYYYTHDVRGNMTEMPHLDAMYWNISNEQYRIENGTMEAYYQYAGGERIRKWVDKGNIKEERIYLGSFEIYRIFDGSSSLTLERQTVHVSDDSGRIAMLETCTFGTDPSPATLERYIYSNHLQSASLELNASGDIISYEEYHPFGTTSYQANNATINAVAKRYRYTGKERDEESGFYYHGARYYIPWLCRWSAVDALEVEYTPQSPYNYANNNPIVFNDPSGMEGEKSGLWIETFNARTNVSKLHWVEGASTYEEAIKNHTPLEGSDFTGNYYQRFAFYNGKGTVWGLSDGKSIFPSDYGFSSELLDIVTDGAIYTFDEYTETRIKNIVERNKMSGIKVDNFGTIRQSPGVYKNYYSRLLRGEDPWINLGGRSARGSWTTRPSAWQDPFVNYMTPDAMTWSRSGKLFSEGLGLLGDAFSIVEVALGESPLSLLPIPVVMIVNEQAIDVENDLFEIALNNESLEGMQDWVSGSLRNTKAPLYEYYLQLRFIYTSDEQVNILKNGQLNIENSYFSYPNESTTKVTLIHAQDNKITILKTYDYKK